MKCSIAWHEDTFKNRSVTLERKKKQLADLHKEVNEMCQENHFYQLQIHEAKKIKKDGFDQDKFMGNVKYLYVTKGE